MNWQRIGAFLTKFANRLNFSRFDIIESRKDQFFRWIKEMLSVTGLHLYALNNSASINKKWMKGSFTSQLQV
jgi:hypothetical protein